MSDLIVIRWRECLARYLERPGSATPSLEQELTYLEGQLLANPPPGCGTGLIQECRQPPPRSVSLEEAGIKVVPLSEWPERIAELSSAKAWPNSHVWTVFNQGSVGSCASEALCGAMQVLRAIEGQQKIVFNPYGVYGRVNGGRDAGSSLQDNLSFIQQYGCFPEDVWPRSKGWRAEPTKEAYEAAKAYRLKEAATVRNREEFGSAVMDGHPVYCGYPGHAIFGVEIIDQNRFWYMNSWGPNWGINGRGTLSFSQVAWYYGAYAILTPRWGDSN